LETLGSPLKVDAIEHRICAFGFQRSNTSSEPVSVAKS
jgi:hypothetical protein